MCKTRKTDEEHVGLECFPCLQKPGTLLEWETEWRRGLEARRKFVEPIGAWFSQVGRLHQVHHMWQYPSLQARLKKREQAWQVDTWSKTVSNVCLHNHLPFDLGIYLTRLTRC